jgi:hypothetical protein
MSLNIVPLQTVQEIAPVCNLSKLDKRQYAVFNGGSEISYQTYLSQNINNQTIQLTTMPPDEKTIIDPMQIRAHVTYLLTFTGTSTSGNLIQLGTADAPRFMPFSSTCNTQQVQINGQAISTLTNQWLPAFSRYMDVSDKLEKELTTPTQLDECTDFSQLFGQNRSPMALFGENTEEKSRGGFSGITILTNTPTSATIQLKTTEPILIPSIYFNKSGLINVRTMNWLYTFGDLRRIWCHDAVNGNNITNLAVNITDFNMSFRFITPKILQENVAKACYSYHEIVPINQATNTVIAPGGKVQISLSSINLQAIPKDFIFWVSKALSDQAYTDADSAFRIDSISVNFMNRVGLLSSCPIESLYDICKENGYNGNWDLFNKYNGSYVKLRVGKDIGLTSLLAPGLLVNPQFSLVVNATNIGLQSFAPCLYCQILYEGVLTIDSNGSMSKSTAVLSSTDVLNSQLASAKVIESKVESIKSYSGGDLFGDIVEAGQNIVKLAQGATSIGMQVAPLLGAAMVGGRKKAKPKAHRRGGDMISREDLMNNMEDMDDEY